jgi:hypothetical protein
MSHVKLFPTITLEHHHTNKQEHPMHNDSYLLRWINITRTNHTIFGIFWRDPNYTKRNPETGEEEYTTKERVLMAIFYCTTLLCFNLTANLIIYTINSTCDTSNLCMASCKSANASCIVNTDWIGPFNTPKPIVKLTRDSKAPNFAVRLRPAMVFNYTSNPSSEYFSTCQSSYNCINACVEKDVGDVRPLCSTVPLDRRSDLICLSPKNTCKLDSKSPEALNQKEVSRFLIYKIVVSGCTSLLINLLITPTRMALKMVFEGVCRPTRDKKAARVMYTLIADAIIIAGVVVCMIWLAIALYALYGYFQTMPTRTKNAIISSTVIFWAISITIVDLVFTALFACVGRKIFCPKN